MQMRVEVNSPMAEYYEIDLDGVAYRLRPTLSFIRRQDELREHLAELDDNQPLDIGRLEEILRPAMKHHHSDEEIDTFFDSVTMPQAMAFMTGLKKMEDEEEKDFTNPPTEGESQNPPEISG